LRKHVAYQFSFSEEIWDVNALGPRSCATETLFPPPEQDFFFAELLKQVSNRQEPYYPLKDFIISPR
jgi:hypothetical protein